MSYSERRAPPPEWFPPSGPATPTTIRSDGPWTADGKPATLSARPRTAATAGRHITKPGIEHYSSTSPEFVGVGSNNGPAQTHFSPPPSLFLLRFFRLRDPPPFSLSLSVLAVPTPFAVPRLVLEPPRVTATFPAAFRASTGSGRRSHRSNHHRERPRTPVNCSPGFAPRARALVINRSARNAFFPQFFVSSHPSSVPSSVCSTRWRHVPNGSGRTTKRERKIIPRTKKTTQIFFRHTHPRHARTSVRSGNGFDFGVSSPPPQPSENDGSSVGGGSVEGWIWH